jgi:hypothetical protein
MKILKYWKVILVLALVFTAGAVTGSVWTTVHFKHAFERGFKLENWTAEAMKVMRKDLHLTTEQEPKVRAIVEETGLKFKETFGRAIKESGGNMVDSWRRIDQELTAEQREIHRRKCQEFREGVKKALNIDLPAE